MTNDNNMKSYKHKGFLTALGGALALLVVMGIGRFAFTPLLPGMMVFHNFGDAVAGMMGSWNFAGYLAGVLLARKEKPGQRRYILFAVFLLLSLITTAGMGLAREIYLLHTIRFLAGFASGMCFVLISAIVLDTLSAVNRPILTGLLYSGVGAGIVIGGLTAGPLEEIGSSPAGWLGMAALCVPLVAVSIFALHPSRNYAPFLPNTSAAADTTAPHSGQDCGSPGRSEVNFLISQKNARIKYNLLLISYFLEGFSYIIGMTFIVALVQNVTESPEIARASWIMTGISAAVSVPIWKFLSTRKGYLPMLILAFILQALGMLLPILSGSVIAALSGGLLLGGTFMGITTLSLQYGVLLSNKPSANTVAVMTALYGIGLTIGPIVAGGMGFYIAFVISALSMLAAAGILFAARLLQSH